MKLAHRRHFAVGALVLVALWTASPRGMSQSRDNSAPGGARWVAAWATSQQTLGTTPISNATVRLIARVTVPGDAVRIRLDKPSDYFRIGASAMVVVRGNQRGRLGWQTLLPTVSLELSFPESDRFCPMNCVRIPAGP